MRTQFRACPLWLVFIMGACVRAPIATDDLLLRAPVMVGPLPRAQDAYPLCPPALTGARTDLQDVDQGIVLDVTASDPDIAASIRTRAAGLMAAVADAGHSDFDAARRGGLAACPVVVEDTEVTTVAIDRGVRFVVVTSADEVDWLRRETRALTAELRVPTPFTPGLARCPNALPSASTVVSDTPGGVVITVISRDPEVAKAIRARAWHRAAEARGEGSRGDGEATSRCPVVVDDVSVTEVDVPGGSEITIRPESADKLEALRRTVRTRSAALP